MMPNHVGVKRSQKNQVFESIKHAGLDPSQFEWGVGASGFRRDRGIDVLRCRGTSYFFAFDESHDDGLYAIYSPGLESSEATRLTISWDNQHLEVREWLALLKQELEAPDLWADIKHVATVLGAHSTVDEPNSLFSMAEVARTL